MCCSESELIESYGSDFPNAQDITPECQEKLNYLTCWACSPSSRNYIAFATRKATACEWFCDEVYAACRFMSVPVQSSSSKQLLQDKYADGSAFCSANGFDVMTNADPADLNAPCYQPRDGIDFFASDAESGSSSAAAASALAGAVAAALCAYTALTGVDIVLDTAGLPTAQRALGGVKRRTGALRSVPLLLAVAACAWLPAATAASSQDYPPVEYCPYMQNRAPRSQPRTQHCPWYSPLACCNNGEAEMFADSREPLPGASPRCLAALDYHACWPCAPYQQYFYDRVNFRVTMCESWCDTLHSLCSGAQFKGQTVGERFETGADFCRAMHFDVSPENDFDKCFMQASDHGLIVKGSAASAGASMLAVAVAGVASVLSSGSAPSMDVASLAPRKRTKALWTLLLACVASMLGVTAAIAPAEVKAGADALSVSLQRTAEDILRRDDLQALYDGANTTGVSVDRAAFTSAVAGKLQTFFSSKLALVDQLAAAAETAHAAGKTAAPATQWPDSDVPTQQYTDLLAYNSAFKNKVDATQGWVKVPDAVPRDGTPLRRDIAWSANLNDDWNANRAADPDVRWQYIGTSSGMFRQSPGTEWGTNHLGLPSDFDTRFRPWYVGAISGPKDVVIVMDCSASMSSNSAWGIAKNAAKLVLDTLTADDHVNVVCAAKSHWPYKSFATSPPIFANTRSVGCVADRMLPATASIVNDFKARLDTISPSGATDFAAGINLANNIMRAQGRQACQRIMVYITDGETGDGNGVRCGPGRTVRSSSSSSGKKKSSSSSRYEPGPLCEASFNSGYSAARLAMANVPGLRVLGVTVGSKTLSQFTSNLACDIGKGVQVKLPSYRDMGLAFAPYFTFLSQRTAARSAVVSAPYVDASGLGLVMTVSKPVYDTTNDELVGVVGVDVALTAVEAIVANARWGDVYGFIINSDGETISHPLLKPTAQLSDSPVFPDIELLEGKLPAFLTVRNAMRQQQAGSTVITGQKKTVRLGDAVEGVTSITGDFAYHYAPIPGAGMSFALVFSVPADNVRTEVESPYNSSTTQAPHGVNWYHRIEKYLEPDPAIPGLSGAIAAQKAPADDSTSFYPGIYVTPTHTTYKLSPLAYCNPAAFVENVFADGVQQLHSYFNTWGGARQPVTACDASDSTNAWSVRPQVRAEVELTHRFDGVWLNRSSAVTANTVWTYFGSTNGVFRVMPGSRWGHEYDPSRRPWFDRAQYRPSLVSVSTPYLDAGGAGRVSTLSMPVFFGKPAAPAAGSCGAQPFGAACNCTASAQCASGLCYDGTCSHESLAGVVATDFKYSFFQGLALDAMSSGISDATRKCDRTYACPTGVDSTTCRTACYLLDDAALLSVASVFGQVPASDTYTFTNVGLGRLHGAVAAALVAEGVIERSVRQDFQGKCSVTPAYEAVPASSQDLVMTVAEAEDGAVTRGKFAPFGNSFACLQSVQSYSISESAFEQLAGSSGVAQIAYSSGCAGGTAMMARVGGTNTYTLVIENMFDNSDDPFRFACHVENRLTTQGATQSLNGTCAEVENSGFEPTGTCPALSNPTVQCDVQNAAAVAGVPQWLLAAAALLAAVSGRAWTGEQ